MQRPGTNPDDVRMSDILCDFCLSEWTEDRLMVEGHHGSVICGNCLRVAYTAVSVDETDDSFEGWTCTMCLEQRSDPAWRSPMRDEALICRRCIKLAARQLERDPESGWKRPEGDQPGDQPGDE